MLLLLHLVAQVCLPDLPSITRAQPMPTPSLRHSGAAQRHAQIVLRANVVALGRRQRRLSAQQGLFLATQIALQHLDGGTQRLRVRLRNRHAAAELGGLVCSHGGLGLQSAPSAGCMFSRRRQLVLQLVCLRLSHP